ncbi:hypothetical protein VTN96DRAFT_924 [Rasamsonia emersonii]
MVAAAVSNPAERGASSSSSRKLRSACDSCHHTKVKCSGGRPCEKCRKMGFDCVYSASNRIGRPKNTRNKKTLERIRRCQEAQASSAIVEKQRTAEACLDWAVETMHDDCLPSLGDFSSMSLDGMATDDFLLPLSSFDAGTNAMDDIDILNPSAALQSTSPDSPVMAGIDPSSSTSSPTQTISHPGHDSGVSAPSEESSLPSSPGHVDLTIDPSANTPVPHHTSDVPLPSPPPSAMKLSFSHSEPTGLATRPCKCLADQAGLLVYLKGLSTHRAVPRVDAALLGTSRALATWRTFLRCRTCWPGWRRSTDVLESLTLAAMNARLVVQVLQTQVQSLLTSSNRIPNALNARCDDDDGDEMEHPVRARLGTYAAGPAEARMLSAMLLFRASNQVDAVLRQFRMQAERLDTGSVSARGRRCGDDSEQERERVREREREREAERAEGGDWQLSQPWEDSESEESEVEGDGEGDNDSARQARQVQGTLRWLEQRVRRLRGSARRCVGVSLQSG